jgi:DNA-directed RNA polymerase specialized sigma24 family protein
VSELDADLREALVRRDILDQSAESAAQELGITLTALKSRLHRARLEARRLLLTSITDGQRKNAGDKSIFRILG